MEERGGLGKIRLQKQNKNGKSYGETAGEEEGNKIYLKRQKKDKL